jgi:AcrR family transcriptional regulator
MATTAEPRSLRADAQRNQDRIVVAAQAAFAALGYEVPIEEIARRAGVGAATVYRRFPNKQRLLRAILDLKIGELQATIAAAHGDPDALHGLLAGMRAVIKVQAANMAFLQVFAQAGVMPELKQELRERVFAPLEELFARAQAAGQLRRDVDPHELALLIQMAAAPAKHAGEGECPLRGTAERYLTLLVDALRTPEPSPLPD